MLHINCEVTGDAAIHGATGWTLLRQKRKDSECYPLRLEWEKPVLGPAVVAYIIAQYGAHHEEYRPYKRFDVYPTNQPPE